MRLLSLVAVLPTCILGMSGCYEDSAEAGYSSLVLGGFSPDGKVVSLSYCTTESRCAKGLYDLERNTFSPIIPLDPDYDYSPGQFSPDGQQLAVSVRRKSDGGRQAQIGIVSIATGHLEELTNGEGHRAYPSFSHDGRQLIFSQANKERESGATRFSDWDVYALDIATGAEQRLTAFRFYLIFPPAYLPDDTHYIFSGVGPKDYYSPLGVKGNSAYKARYGEHRIFIRSSDVAAPLEPVFRTGELSTFPLISGDGTKIVYYARTDRIDGPKFGGGYTYDFYLFDGVTHRRLTKQDDLIADAVMSPDGARVVYSAQPRKQLQLRALRILDVNTGTVSELDPAHNR